MLSAAFFVALSAIRRNPLRSILTTLGVVIGVASVIAMVTLGRGATASVTRDIASLGHNMLIVLPGADRRLGSSASAQPFSWSDVQAMREGLPTIDRVAPSVGGATRLVYGNRNWST
ncbi:MAG: ABC transporter permease, partial [Deltaproteobacteria bacterium]|nr:ABC transporter permease [Deltaproteobacteria bacterium]